RGGRTGTSEDRSAAGQGRVRPRVKSHQRLLGYQRRDAVVPRKIIVIGVGRAAHGVNRFGGITLIGNEVVTVIRIHAKTHSPLLQIIQALDGLGFLLGQRQRRQEHGRQNRDNRDHYQQLNESESPVGLALLL